MITFVIIVLIFGGFLIKKNYMNKYFLFISLFLAIISFFIESYYATDLYKYYRWIETFRGANDINIIFRQNYFADRYIWGGYLFGISKLPHNGFLPSISVLIYYSIIFDLVNKISEKFNINKKNILFAFIFLMLYISYGGVVYGIRNHIAFAILARTLYIDIVENKNKKKCFITYLLLTQLHSSTIIFIFIRFALYLKNKYTKTIINLTLLFWRFTLLPVSVKIFSMINFPALTKVIEKVEVYIDNERFSGPTMYSKVILLIAMILVYLFYKKLYIKEYNNYNKLMELVFLFTIGSFQQFDLFIRCVNITVYLFLFYLMTLYKIASISKSGDKDYVAITGYKERHKYQLLMFRFVLLLSAFIVFLADYITLGKYVFFNFR